MIWGHFNCTAVFKLAIALKNSLMSISRKIASQRVPMAGLEPTLRFRENGF